MKSELTAIFKRNGGYGSTVEAGGCRRDAQKSVSGDDVFLTRMLASPLAQVNCHASAVLLYQCFSTFVRPRPGKFFFHKTRARSQQIYS